MHNLFPTSVVEIDINSRRAEGIIDLIVPDEEHTYFVKLWDGRDRIKRHQRDMKIKTPLWQPGAMELREAG